MEWTEQMYRPPQEAKSLLLRGSQGCTYNRCHFCYISRESPFGVVAPEEIEQELLRQIPLHPQNTRVYLFGSNPFSQSFGRLKEIAKVIKKHLPLCPEISMHARVTDIVGKSPEQLEELKHLGINHLYPGTENGNDEALRLMNKGARAEQALEQLRKLDEAGIAYTVNYIIGMGGDGEGESSGIHTARLFNQLRPRRITTTGLTVFPHTPLYEMVQKGVFKEASEREKIAETIAFVKHLNIETTLDCGHYLNLLNFIADLPAQKAQALHMMSAFLQKYSECEILEFYPRKHFTTL